VPEMAFMINEAITTITKKEALSHASAYPSYISRIAIRIVID